jgi:hypothetical protein
MLMVERVPCSERRKEERNMPHVVTVYPAGPAGVFLPSNVFSGGQR